MSDFIQKRDYLTFVFFSCVFMISYFLSKEFSSNNLLVVLPVSSIGAFGGYKVSCWLTNKSITIKVICILVICVIFIGAILINGLRADDQVQAYRLDSPELLMGKWETDEEEGYKIILVINQKEAIMSMSPKFEEIQYDLIVSDNSLQLSKRGILKFNFVIENIKDSTLIFSHLDERLMFTRIY